MTAKIEKFINKLNGKTVSLTHKGHFEFTDVLIDFEIAIWTIGKQDMISFAKGRSENYNYFIEIKDVFKIVLSKNTITFKFKDEHLLMLEVLD